MGDEGVDGGRPGAREGMEDGREGEEDGREDGGRLQRRKFEKLKRKKKIYGIEWDMGD